MAGCQCNGNCRKPPFTCSGESEAFTISMWANFPDTAPKDRKIMVYGEWQSTEDHPNQGGSPIYVMVHWTTLMSNNTGYNWYTATFETLDNYPVVKWLYWTEIPRYLGRLERFEQELQRDRGSIYQNE